MYRKKVLPVKTILIACETIKKELLAAMKSTGTDFPVVWLESGLHNVPKKLNEVLQEKLDLCEGYDTVLLGLSLCGNSVLGLKTRDYQLVIPKCDDCISMLLGDSPRLHATMFLTQGWLDGGHHLGQEYDLCMEKYGEKRGKRIFAALLKNYRCLALLDTGCFDADAAETEIRAMAEKLGLEVTTLQGSIRYLEELLSGNWDPTRFVVLPANSTLTADLFGR